MNLYMKVVIIEYVFTSVGSLSVLCIAFLVV